MPVELYQTKDHSHTLYVPELDETYHSRNGAVEEAMYVYIGRGLRDMVVAEESAVRSPQSAVEKSSEKKTTLAPLEYPNDGISAQQKTADRRLRIADHPIALLEVGFGTGLNAWLTAIECASLNIQCVYHSLETFPLDTSLIAQLNYPQEATASDKQLFLDLHTCHWNESTPLSPFFELTKIAESLQTFVAPVKYDIIYFDAFAPDKQPELWTEPMFQKLYDCLNPGGVIVTYSSKGEIKRTWKKVGFEVERLPGPPMKRHMLRGRKK